MSTSIEPLDRFHLAEDYHQKYRVRSERGAAAEFRAVYPDEDTFLGSTAVARVNGWLDGYGTPEEIAAELPLTGLSEGAQDAIRRRAHR